MRRPLGGALALWIVLAGVPGVGTSQENGLARRHHSWARFEPGAWKLVRVVTETFDEQGVVNNTSVTETATCLAEVGKDSVTLEVQTTVEVAGKRFEAEPQTIKQGFHGELAHLPWKLKEPTLGHVLIEGRKVPCRIQQLEAVGLASKSVAHVYFSDTVSPYVLRRESVTTDLEGSSTLSEITVAVEAQDLPWKVLNRLKTGTLVRTVQKHTKGTVTTWAVMVSEVPGGVVSHTSKELDQNGRLTRRSTLELVDYGLTCDDERLGPVWRKRRLRREPTIYYVPPAG